MKVTVNQRLILLVILAIIFVLALLKGIMQSPEVEQSIAQNPPITINHQNNKPPELQLSPENSMLHESVKINSASAKEIANKLEGIGEAIAQSIVQRR